MIRLCKRCSNDITGTHHNRKYCSNVCYEKERYKRTGSRTTPEQRKKYYQKRLEQEGYSEKLQEQGRKRAKKVRDFMNRYKIMKRCRDCGYKQHHVALDFDHVIGEKIINVCNAKSIKQAKKEIRKCEVVCSNCHRIRTYKRLYPCKPDVFKETYDELG